MTVNASMFCFSLTLKEALLRSLFCLLLLGGGLAAASQVSQVQKWFCFGEK